MAQGDAHELTVQVDMASRSLRAIPVPTDSLPAQCSLEDIETSDAGLEVVLTVVNGAADDGVMTVVSPGDSLHLFLSNETDAPISGLVTVELKETGPAPVE